MPVVARLIGLRPPGLLGSALVGLGLLLAAYVVGMDSGLLPGSRVAVPEPPALARPRVRDEGTATAPSLPLPVPAGAADGPITSTGPLDPADPPEGEVALPPPGRAVRLRIPSIALVTDVVPAGMAINRDGEVEWETVPFVAAHYVESAPVGGRGNAVVAGHVVTVREGNVFADLYRVDYDDRIEVETTEGVFTYAVDELRLVAPSEVQWMDPTADATLTLMTCGGEFDPRARRFSHRLIVIAKLVGGSGASN